MVPIALGVAATLGVDPRPFVVGSCIAASAALCDPYRLPNQYLRIWCWGHCLTDFTRVGLLLNLICMTVTLVVPVFWKF